MIKHIWLIYNKSDYTKNQWFAQHLIEEGKKIYLEIELVFYEDIILGIAGNCYVERKDGKLLQYPEAAIVRVIDSKLSFHLECCGIRVFNSSYVSRICNDKGLAYEKISQLGIQTIPTVLCKREDLYYMVQKSSLPLVVKTIDGHGGQEVFLLKDYAKDTVTEILSKTNSDFVIQPLVGTLHQDLRVYVLGGTVIGCILRTANGEFKSNYSLGGSVKSYELSPEQKAIINKILLHYTFDYVGIDFLLMEDETIVFNEIEDVVGARMLYKCSNIDVGVLYLEYIKGCLQNVKDE